MTRYNMIVFNSRDELKVATVIEDLTKKYEGREGFVSSDEFLNDLIKRLEEKGVPNIVFFGLEASNIEEANRIVGEQLSVRSDWRNKLKLGLEETYSWQVFPVVEREIDFAVKNLRERHWLFGDLVSK